MHVCKYVYVCIHGRVVCVIACDVCVCVDVDVYASMYMQACVCKHVYAEQGLIG